MLQLPTELMLIYTFNIAFKHVKNLIASTFNKSTLRHSRWKMIRDRHSVNEMSSVCLRGRALFQDSGRFNPSRLQRDLPQLFPLQCLWKVCACVLPNPLFKPPVPSLPFLFHTLSAVLTHSFRARPKTGTAAPESGTPVLKLTQTAGTH